ncbi:MAG: hypothetical protein H0U71_02035 [Gammaproteobacteria bacterium]|nr:hypothetical protein [Gammaproteobacteria bacterium]
MSESRVSENYLLEAKISFLIISFIVCIISVTVQQDIWPFLQTTLPFLEFNKAWSIGSIIFGGVIPLIWLYLDWLNKPIRYSLLSIIIMFILQVTTEFCVSYYFFASMVVPTSILYISYRLVQLSTLHRMLYKTTFVSWKDRSLRLGLLSASLIFWSLLWVRLTFLIFPKIIYDIF